MDASDLKGLFAEVKKRMDGQIEHVIQALIDADQAERLAAAGAG